MKGRREFKTNEADEISALLHKKVKSDSNEQKNIRNKIRSMGFYISDFDHLNRGFSDDDFKVLIEKGQVKIIDK